METRFQTSFIPRKPLVPASSSMSPAPHHHTISGLFVSIATALLVISLLSVVGAYLWKSYLTSAQASYRTELTAREQQFNVQLIQQLESASVQINLAKQVLADHVAASQVFPIIGDLTAENVRFMSLDFTGPATPQGDSKITLSGSGQSLSAVAFQSDVLGMLSQYGLSNIVKNPILSDPAQNEDGSVGFNFSATVDPSALTYEKVAANAAGQTQSATGTSTLPSSAASVPSNPPSNK